MDIPFDRVDIAGPFGKNKEKPYLDLNPNGVVPTIEDEGFVLWESNSIVLYLIEKYGQGRLLPTTVETRASAHRWMDWQQTVMNAFMVILYLGLIRKSEGERDMATIEKARQQAALKWEIVDRYLNGSSYLAGDSFSLGDIPLGVWAHRWFNLPIDRARLHGVEQWYERLCERVPYQKHIMIPLT